MDFKAIRTLLRDVIAAIAEAAEQETPEWGPKGGVSVYVNPKWLEDDNDAS
jgi:hypothetical protein